MSEVVTQAVLPWRIDRRHMFPRGIAPSLIVLLLMQRRLQRQAEDFALALGQAQPLGHCPLAQQRRLVVLYAQLTRGGLWLLAMAPFLPRFGCNKDEATGQCVRSAWGLISGACVSRAASGLASKPVFRRTSESGSARHQRRK